MARKPSKSKLYTRTGDRGSTALFGGKRVPKDHPRVVAYGTLDELNSIVGVAVSFIRQRRLIASLQTIQSELFDIGAELASERPVRRAKRSADTFSLGEEATERLEALIDEYDARVPPLRTFILPGGTTAAAMVHLARTVCRRAEREVVTLSRKETVNPVILSYLNRLNDLLFVIARYLNKTGGRREIRWRSS